jgi:hypothetical protein
MRNYYLVILVLFLSSCGTNKLKGIYCQSFNGGDDSTCLTFKEDNKFAYRTSGDLGTYITGKGQYILRNKTLKLIFDKDSVIQKSEVNIEDWSFRDDEETDSIDLIFKVSDGHNKELPLYARISEESSDFAYSKENYVNRNGALTITKPKSLKTEVYKIEFIGYEILEIELKHDSTKEITATLYPAQPHLISGTTHSYILKDIKKDSFLTSEDYLYRKVK